MKCCLWYRQIGFFLLEDINVALQSRQNELLKSIIGKIPKYNLSLLCNISGLYSYDFTLKK